MIMPVFKKHFYFSRFLLAKLIMSIFIALGALVNPFLAVGQNLETFTQKMEKLLAEQEKVSQKLVSALQIRDYLEDRIDTLKQEIIEIKRKKDITSYAKAVQFPRIRYNLSLLRQLRSYEVRLHERVEELKVIGAELSYLYQLLADDLKMFKAVNHIEATERLNKVEEVILNHSWLDQPYLFEKEGLVFTKPQKIWADFIARK